MSVQEVDRTSVGSANWYVDPLGRFQGRFFDGNEWTDKVSLHGRLATDPAWPPTAEPVQPVLQADVEATPAQTAGVSGSAEAVSTAAPERRAGIDRRQVNLPGAPNRRVGDRRQPELVIPGP